MHGEKLVHAGQILSKIFMFKFWLLFDALFVILSFIDPEIS